MAGEEFTESSYSLNYGPSKDKMLYIFLAYVTAMVAGIVYVIWRLRGYNKPDVSFKQILERETRKQAKAEEAGAKESVEENKDSNNDTGSTRRRNLASRRLRENHKSKTKITADEHSDHSQDDYDMLEEEPNPEKSKMGAKKLRKLQEKEERKALREEMELERQERKERQEAREKLRQMEEEKQRGIEKQKEEEERLAKEKKEKEEHELYLELKKNFELTEEGQDEVEDEDSLTNKLEEFINYLKDKKVVLLEDLASHFGLRTQDAIDRVQQLLQNETITGVIDDRGKFIYISQEEMEAVANFVKRRGRVAISEIAAASNKLINLAP